jgi:hypothetical protein
MADEVVREGQSSVKVTQHAKSDPTIEAKLYRPPADPVKGTTFEELDAMAKDVEKVIAGFDQRNAKGAF